MKNMTDTISRYVSAWNEETPEAVEAAFAECCVQGVIYTDKNARTYTEKQTPLIEGIDQLTALVMGSHTKVPGRTFSMLTAPQYFDGHCHYSWGLHIPGNNVKAGWDYIQYNEEGLITHIVGFLPQA
jgi:hypothetical protein